VKSSAWTVVGGPWPVVGMGLGCRPRDVSLGGAGQRALVAGARFWVAACCADGWCGEAVSGAVGAGDRSGGVYGMEAGTGFAAVVERT
jgi:hypothetical protein